MAFTITLKHEQYQTYILSDQTAQSRLEIVPERGGMVTNWRIQGQDILYLDAERFANPQQSVRGGIPILFPICGDIPGDVYLHRGQSYTLKRHGFARDLPWEVSDRSTQDCASLTLTLNSNDQTRAAYPFDFQIRFTYQLQGQFLKILQRYENHSPEPMPFSTGLHPYFWVTDKSQLAFEIPATQMQDQIMKANHPFTGNFDLTQDEIDVALFPLLRQEASLTNHRRNLQITLRYSDLYTTLVFWTVQGKGYVCLEPWSAPRNAINTGEYLTTLEPGTSCEASVTLDVTEVECKL